MRPTFLRPDAADVFLGQVASGGGRVADIWTLKGESGVVAVLDNISAIRPWPRALLEEEVNRRLPSESRDLRAALSMLNAYEEATAKAEPPAAEATVCPVRLKAYVDARATETELLERLRAGQLDHVADLAGMFIAASNATDRAAHALADACVEAFTKPEKKGGTK